MLINFYISLNEEKQEEHKPAASNINDGFWDF